MNNLQDTESLNEFQSNPAFYTERLKQSQQPLVLTVDGRAELVVLDAETYQEILAKVEFADTVQALKEGIADFERGESRPAREALEELREKYGVSR